MRKFMAIVLFMAALFGSFASTGWALNRGIYDASNWQDWVGVRIDTIFSDWPGEWRRFGAYNQCFMTARLIIYKVNEVDFNRQANGKREIDLNNVKGVGSHAGKSVNELVTLVGQRLGASNEEQVRAEFSKARVGDLVQFYRSSSSGSKEHTFIISGFYDDGVDVLHGGWNRDADTICNQEFTYAQLAGYFASPNAGFSIYRFREPIPDLPWDGSTVLLNRGDFPIKVYTLENRRYDVYADKYLRNKLTSNWTDGSEEDLILEVGKNSEGVDYAYISIPLNNGNRKNVYVNLRNVFVKGSLNEPTHVYKDCRDFYRRRGSNYDSSYVLIADNNSTIFPLTRDNGWVQVCFWDWGENGGARIAWLTEAEYRRITTDNLKITEVPTKTVVAGRYFEFQCEANGNVDVWSSARGTTPSNAGTNVKTTMPPGLSINSNTGRISGTVGHTSPGKSSNMPMYYYFKINASGSGNSAEKGAIIEVVEPPVITTGNNLPKGSLGQAYNQTLTAEGTARGMTWKLKSGSLPDGLEIKFSNDARYVERRTATITGTPTRAGTYTFTLELYNEMYDFLGTSEMRTTKTFTIKIEGGPDPDLIPDPKLYIAYTFMDGKVGKYYNNDWVAARGRNSINRATVSGNYPTGLSFYRSGLKVYMCGTPEESGTFEFTITVYSDYGYAKKTFRVYIAPEETRPYPDPNMSIVYTLCNGSLGNTYGDYVRVSGGTSPYTVQVVSGTLPPGLSATAEGSKIWIRGVPVRYSSTPYTFKLRATGAHNGYAEKELNIKISNNSSYSLAGAGDPDKPTKPKLLTKKLPTAAIGNEVNVQLEAYGTTPITWSCAEVPEGFIFTDTGLIMGVPMEAKNLKFKVTATNSVGSATKSFTLKVKPEKPLITTLTLPDGVAGLPYEFTPEASGTEPLTWSKSGKFPSGLKIDRKTGTISGTPKKAGTYEFKLKAKNKGGTDTVQMTIIINAEEQEKTSSVSASSFVQLRTESRGSVNTELFVIADGEDIEDDVITDAGQPLTFRTGKWVDDAGNEIEVSDVQICINDEPVNNIEAAEDGTFTLPGSYVSGEFCVSARAKYGESELETSDINVTAEAHNEEISLSDSDSSGSCSTNLFGFAGLALCALMAFRKK